MEWNPGPQRSPAKQNKINKALLKDCEDREDREDLSTIARGLIGLFPRWGVHMTRLKPKRCIEVESSTRGTTDTTG